MSLKKLLLMGLDEATASALAQSLPPNAYQVDVVSDGEDEQAAVERFRPDLICVAAGKERYPRLHAGSPFVVVTAKPHPLEWRDALAGGAADYFGPPFLPAQVGAVLSGVGNLAPMGKFLTVSG